MFNRKKKTKLTAKKKKKKKKFSQLLVDHSHLFLFECFRVESVVSIDRLDEKKDEMKRIRRRMMFFTWLRSIVFLHHLLMSMRQHPILNEIFFFLAVAFVVLELVLRWMLKTMTMMIFFVYVFFHDDSATHIDLFRVVSNVEIVEKHSVVNVVLCKDPWTVEPEFRSVHEDISWMVESTIDHVLMMMMRKTSMGLKKKEEEDDVLNERLASVEDD